jgi:Ca2+:H+ antiporter
VVFVINFIAIVRYLKSPNAVVNTDALRQIPLAGLLSFATEEISLRVGETMGGLLNASFG